MTCDCTRDWLLQAEEPSRLEDAPAEVAAHVSSCSACSLLVKKLDKLEADWRATPLPAGVDAARVAFQRRLESLPLQAGRPTSIRRFTSLIRLAAAAVMLLAVGVSGWLLWSPTPVYASDDLVEQLVEWNLRLADADVPVHKPEVARRALIFQEKLQEATLSTEDRELAEYLLETGSWLAAHDDPGAEADRFHAVADRLLKRLQKASARGDAKHAARFEKHYRRMTEKALDLSKKGPKRQKKRDKNPGR